ncbi:WYL domain-containing protein [Microbacterium sp. NRRL B-14842]|uniref:WYL domain-containing protein n=1 Tax=Microbacterium sp. NRRL B-14842 TaxID=3162881 RepID=UPI003D2CC9F6
MRSRPGPARPTACDRGRAFRRCSWTPTTSPRSSPGCSSSKRGARRTRPPPSPREDRKVLPPGLRRRAAATALSTQILRAEPAPAEWGAVGTLADAVAQSARVAFTYTDQHDRASERVIAPASPYLRGGRWYVVASTSTATTGGCSGSTGCGRCGRCRGCSRPGSSRSHRSREWLTSDFGRSGS